MEGKQTYFEKIKGWYGSDSMYVKFVEWLCRLNKRKGRKKKKERLNLL